MGLRWSGPRILVSKSIDICTPALSVALLLLRRARVTRQRAAQRPEDHQALRAVPHLEPGADRALLTGPVRFGCGFWRASATLGIGRGIVPGAGDRVASSRGDRMRTRTDPSAISTASFMPQAIRNYREPQCERAADGLRIRPQAPIWPSLNVVRAHPHSMRHPLVLSLSLFLGFLHFSLGSCLLLWRGRERYGSIRRKHNHPDYPCA
jgi:hypothetical protein